MPAFGGRPFWEGRQTIPSRKNRNRNFKGALNFRRPPAGFSRDRTGKQTTPFWRIVNLKFLRVSFRPGPRPKRDGIVAPLYSGASKKAVHFLLGRVPPHEAPQGRRRTARSERKTCARFVFLSSRTTPRTMATPRPASRRGAACSPRVAATLNADQNVRKRLLASGPDALTPVEALTVLLGEKSPRRGRRYRCGIASPHPQGPTGLGHGAPIDFPASDLKAGQPVPAGPLT